MIRDEPENAALARLLEEARRLGAGDANAGLEARSREAILDRITEAVGPAPSAEREKVYDHYLQAHGSVAGREKLVDAGSEMSFPASDPPSYMGGASTAGAPPHEEGAEVEKPNTRVSDPAEVEPARDDITNPGSIPDPAEAARRRG